MSSCPECRKTLYPNQKKCTCGWKSSDAKQYVNPRHGLCEYNEHGMLCGKAGSIALHTGADGPWYCRQHALGLKGIKIKDHITTPQLNTEIKHENQRNSVMLPGEGLGDYLRAYNQSGLTRSQFDELRLNPVKAFDPEALEERIAIQMESTYE